MVIQSTFLCYLKMAKRAVGQPETMKKSIFITATLLLASVALFSSCKKDEPKEPNEPANKSCTCTLYYGDGDSDTVTIPPSEVGASTCDELASILSGIEGGYVVCK